MAWRKEQSEDDDVRSVLRAESGWADISNQSGELKIVWAQCNFLRINQETEDRVRESKSNWASTSYSATRML